jgi:hypothetical protein
MRYTKLQKRKNEDIRNGRIVECRGNRLTNITGMDNDRFSKPALQHKPM